MAEEFQDCLFCGLDVDIDDNPEWDLKKAYFAIEDKWPAIKVDELFWACRECEKLLLQRIASFNLRERKAGEI